MKANENKFTFIQFPNKYLWTMILTWPIYRFTHGTISAAAQTIFIVAAIIWSYEEIYHGVNWFRKVLGLVVLSIMLLNIYKLII